MRRSIWIVGGDGWAYDIGSSGLDHALARVNTDEANRLMDIAQEAAHLRWSVYEKMAARSAAEFPADGRREL